jgi:hypothetical protein
LCLRVEATCSGQHKMWLKAIFGIEIAYVVQISINM